MIIPCILRLQHDALLSRRCLFGGRFFRWRLGRARLEFEADFAARLFHQKRLELAFGARRDEAVEQIGAAGLQQFAHLLGLDGLLQNDLAAAEVAARRRADALFADIAAARFIHRAAAFGAGAQRLLRTEVGRFAPVAAGRAVTEVEFEFPLPFAVFLRQLEFGGERAAHLAAKTGKRPEVFVAQQLLHFGQLEAASARMFADGKIALRAGVAVVVLLDHAAAVRAGGLQCGVVAGHGVAVEFFGAAHDGFGHAGNVAHEGLARELAALHLRQLVLPAAGELGLGEFFHLQAAQQGHELEGLGGGDQLTALAHHIRLGQQAFDGGRARGRRAQPFARHRLGEFFVFHHLARVFHRAQQGRFGVARGRAGLEGFEFHGLGLHRVALFHGGQVVICALLFLAVDFQPAGFDQNLALGLELMRAHGADARGHQRFRRREEHREKAPRHQVVNLGLGLGECAGRLRGGDDGEVIRHLGVVEHALARTDVVGLQRAACVRRDSPARLGQRLRGLPRHGEIVFGQMARVGSRIGQRLVLFV